jgi:hypothetical protein
MSSFTTYTTVACHSCREAGRYSTATFPRCVFLILPGRGNESDDAFIAVYPRTYDPAYAVGACVLAIVFASTFALLFPLIAPAVVLLLLLTLIGTWPLTH